MSASNWAFCPRCMFRRRQVIEQEECRVDAMYGNVSVSDFDAARASLEALKKHGVREEQDETLREDYEIWLDDGTLKIRYSAHCEACSLTFAVKHEHVLFDPVEG